MTERGGEAFATPPPAAAASASPPTPDSAASAQAPFSSADGASARVPAPPTAGAPTYDTRQVAEVLRRAAALEAEMAQSGYGSGLSAAAIVDAATEVGMDPSAVAMALARHRIGVGGDPSRLDRLIGPATLWSAQTTTASEQETTVALTQWLERGHGLRTRTTPDGVIVARKRGGLAGWLSRSWRTGVEGRSDLGKATEVRAVAVDPVVALAADVSERRNEAMVGGAAVGLAGSAIVAGVAVITTPLTLLALPIVAGVGLVTSRLVLRPAVGEVTDALDETVAAVATGHPPPTHTDTLAPFLRSFSSRLPTRKRPSPETDASS